MGTRLIDMTGWRFGKLTVMHRAGTMYGKYAAWLCKCDCGANVIRPSHDLRSKGKPAYKACKTCAHSRFKIPDHERRCGYCNRFVQRRKNGRGLATICAKCDRMRHRNGVCELCGFPLPKDYFVKRYPEAKHECYTVKYWERSMGKIVVLRSPKSPGHSPTKTPLLD